MRVITLLVTAFVLVPGLGTTGPCGTAWARQVVSPLPLSPTDATVIFSGKVLRSWVSPAGPSGAFTSFLFRELRFAKGERRQDSLVVRAWGGTVGRYRYEMGGDPPEKFQVGRRYAIWLGDGHFISDSVSFVMASDTTVTPLQASFPILEGVGPDLENYIEMGSGHLARMGRDSGLFTEEEFLARCRPFVPEAARH